jgi:hypothetical protein
MEKTLNENENGNCANRMLSASYLINKGFKLVEEKPFEDIYMPYYVKEGIMLLFNTPVEEYNENDFLIGFAEMRCGKYHAVTIKWIKEQKELLSIYKSIKCNEL